MGTSFLRTAGVAVGGLIAVLLAATAVVGGAAFGAWLFGIVDLAGGPLMGVFVGALAGLLIEVAVIFAVPPLGRPRRAQRMAVHK